MLVIFSREFSYLNLVFRIINQKGGRIESQHAADQKEISHRVTRSSSSCQNRQNKVNIYNLLTQHKTFPQRRTY